MSQEKEITVEEAVENQNPEAAQTEQPQPNAEDPNKVVLLGTISYNDEKEYSKWLSEMDVNQAVFVLIAGANFSQAKAAYNLQESELISSAIRALKKNSNSKNEPTTGS
jgi:hypothetical protein